MNRYVCVILSLCIVGAGCGKKAESPAEWELREAAILKCVDQFKAGLVRLSADHSELTTVQHFDTTYLGFTFVNNEIEPRVHISLGVEDGTLSEMESVPRVYEELPDIPAVVSFSLECEGNAELKISIEKLYAEFKKALRKELGDKGSPSKPSTAAE